MISTIFVDCCPCLSDVASSQHGSVSPVSHPIDCLVSYHLADRSFLHILGSAGAGPGDLATECHQVLTRGTDEMSACQPARVKWLINAR